MVEQQPVIPSVTLTENEITLSIGLRQSIPLGGYHNISPSISVSQKVDPAIVADKQKLLNAVASLYEAAKPAYGYLILNEVKLAASMTATSPAKVASDLISLLSKASS